MSSPEPPRRPPRRRRAALAAALGGVLLLAGGCAGYRPLYALDAEPVAGEGSVDVAEALSRIEVGRIAEREGQILRELLIERLDASGRDGTWPLNVVLRISRQDLGIQRDASATRANLRASATITLTDPEGTVRLSRSLDVVTGFSILDDQFATLVAERDARDRALDALADRIRTQLALHFARPPAPADDAAELAPRADRPGADPSGADQPGAGAAG
jgi:LPS-assembly lipoprotein